MTFFNSFLERIRDSGSSTKRFTGINCALLSAFLWGTTFVSARSLLAEGQIDPLSLSVFRFIIAAVVMAGVACFSMPKSFFSIAARDFLSFASLAFCGVTGMTTLLFYGQATTGAINSSVIMQMNPFIIMLLCLFLGERLSFTQLLGAIIALGGSLFVVEALDAKGLHLTGSHMNGDFLIFLSALCWAVYSVFSKNIIMRYGAINATAWIMIFGAVELLLIYLFSGTAKLIPSESMPWVHILYIGIFPSALAFWAWYEAASKIPVKLLNISQFLTPAFTVILSIILLGEKPHLFQYMGIALVAAGIGIALCTAEGPENGDNSEKIFPEDKDKLDETEAA